jgi:hypothetical protein
VALVKVPWPEIHTLSVYIPLDEMGDQRSGVSVIFLLRNNGYTPLPVNTPDAFHTSDAASGVTYDEVFLFLSCH